MPATAPAIRTDRQPLAGRNAALHALLAACAAATLLVASNPAHAADLTLQNPCTTEGRQQTRTLLEERRVPEAEDLLEAYTKIFCGRSSLKAATQRVGFPFTVVVPAVNEDNSNPDSEASPHYERLLGRAEFVEQYAFLSSQPSITAVSNLSYSAKADVLTLTQSAVEGGGNEVKFRRYRNQWIWFADKTSE